MTSLGGQMIDASWINATRRPIGTTSRMAGGAWARPFINTRSMNRPRSGANTNRVIASETIGLSPHALGDESCQYT